MLHVYILKSALAKVPEGGVTLEIPESFTHKVLGMDIVIPLERMTAEGWLSWLNKGKRIISDGSPTVAIAQEKVERLCGIGKPIGEKTVRDSVTSTLVSYVLKDLVKAGHKRDAIGKFPKTLEEVKTFAVKHGLAETRVKKLLAHAKKIAALMDADIE